MRIDHLFVHTIYIASATGVNSQGEYTYGAATAVKARVEQKRQEIIRPDGTRYEANHEIMTTTEIKPTTRIWLPGQSTSNTKLARVPQQVKSADDIRGGNRIYLVSL